MTELDSLINKLQISYEHQVSVFNDPDGQCLSLNKRDQSSQKATDILLWRLSAGSVKSEKSILHRKSPWL
jgi:hypothetical protein